MQVILINILAFIVAIGVLVTVHEFGHYWVARRMGVKVLRFSIGFGKPIFKWHTRSRHKSADPDTEFVIAAIPLGGYVKMLDEREGDVDATEVHLAFNRKSLAARSAIVVAGPLANFIFAIFAFWGVLVLGEEGLRPLIGEVAADSPAQQMGFRNGDEVISVNGTSTPTWSRVLFVFAGSVVVGDETHFKLMGTDKILRTGILQADVIGDLAEVGDPLKALGVTPDLPSVPAVFGKILPGEAAAAAGLKSGDRVLSADGEVISDWIYWVKFIRARPGKIIDLIVDRGGQQINLEIIPASIDADGESVGRIGAANQPVEGLWDGYRIHYSMPLLEAVPAAAMQSWDFSVLTLKVMWRILTGEASVKNLGGPITIADAAGQAASIGFVAFLKLMAIISISLGVLNLLPIPVLDGGHLFYYLIEAITKKPVSEAIQIKAQQIGMTLMLALMVLVIYQDISRLLS